jgi:putative transposase
VSRYLFVDDHKDAYGVKRLCRLSQVSRSGYYDWIRRQHDPGPRARRDGELLTEIEAVYSGSRCTYGAPRVHGQLRRAGQRVGRKRVARLMRNAGLVGAHTRRKWRRGRPDIAPAPDLLNRDFTAAAPNTKWVADLTEFTTGEGKLHLAGVRDLCTKELVGWGMGARRTADLVVDALVMALGRRDIDEDTGVIHHADHGSQYTSLAFDVASDVEGLSLSFGSTGDCYDNAAMETFWATVKREIGWIRGSTVFATRAEATTYLFEYLEVFYNRQRHQTALGDLTPHEYYQQVTA